MIDEDDPDEIEVEWDINKETINQRKHAISFYKESMKKAISFKGGVRGKYARKKITILGASGIAAEASERQPGKQPPLVVSIDEDITIVFKTPEAINQVLRGLIQIMTVADRWFLQA